MLMCQVRHLQLHGRLHLLSRFLSRSPNSSQSAIPQQLSKDDLKQEHSPIGALPVENKNTNEIFPTARVIPMMLTNKESVVLPFDDVPGPKSLKYLSTVRQYLSDIGTQLTAGILTFGVNIG